MTERIFYLRMMLPFLFAHDLRMMRLFPGITAFLNEIIVSSECLSRPFYYKQILGIDNNFEKYIVAHSVTVGKMFIVCCTVACN
jgi:hypothetical protein